jgi:uncharacterized protein (DUF885 family)
MAQSPHPFDAWLDDFLATFFRQNPVDATFIGMHDHDHELPDCSPEGIERAKDEWRGLQERLSQIPTDGLTAAQRIDHRLATGFIEIRLWELDSGHFAKGNPSYYTGEAIFGIIALFQRDAEPFADRVAAAIDRMRAIPGFLTLARNNLASAPTAWTERAMRECRSALIYFGAGLRNLPAERSISDSAFLAAADGAHAAFTAHLSWLEGTLLTNPNEDYACGRDAFERYLTAGHCLPSEQNADWVLATAQQAMQAAQAELEARAAAIDPNKSWQELLAGLADLHPSAEDYYATYGRVWQEAKDAAVAADLVTWPDFPIEFVPFPASDRDAAAGLYYLFYRCPPALGYHDTHRYLVTPVEPDMAAEEQERRLRATNDSVIKLNHVVHHGGLGHHVQNWNAFRAESRIGQIAGTDAASRIAFFCAGTLVEGWACYATDLAEEIGFLTPLEALSEQQSRARMAARAIADVSIHTGQMTLAEAAAFYEREAGMSPAAAHGESVKNSMFPGAAMMYLSGTSAIHALREKIVAREGAAFNLRDFHDRFLGYGAVPVALIAEEMLSS